MRLSLLQYLLLGIILMCCFLTFYTVISRNWSEENAVVRDVHYYEQLIAKTRRMIQDYKELSGGAALPANLMLQPISATRTPQTELRAPEELPIEVENTPQSSSASKSSDGEVSTPRDLVMGVAHNIDPKNLAVFIKSLKEVSKAALILFVNTPTEELVDRLANENHVKLIRYDQKKLPEKVRSYHPSTLRWYLYRDFFIERDGYKLIYNRVWLLDVRDTYFQRDPFTIFTADTPSLNVFGGVESKAIRRCGWNSGWIRDCFGERTLTAIGNEKIICSGVTAGTMEEVAQYIDIMGGIALGEESYQRINNKALSNKFPTCERNGVDQGIHNVLVHMKLLPSLHLYDQRSGPVANLQAKVATVDGDKVYNANNQLVHVVHQYDRYPDFQKLLFLKYVDWINVADFVGEWNAASQCKAYNYRENVDIFKGKCDLAAKGGATSAVSCCKHCNDAIGCQAFTFVGGTCFLKSCKEQAQALTLKDAISATRKG